METCVSMNCPFMMYCREYNFQIDRTGGCDTQRKILHAARQLVEREKPSIPGKDLGELTMKNGRCYVWTKNGWEELYEID